MKQNFVRIKTRAKSVSLRTLALVMGLVMLLSAVGVGSTLSAFALTNDGSGNQAASLSAAADLGTGIADTATQLKPTLPAYANASLRGMQDDLVSTGAKADLAATGETGHTVYMCPHNLGWDSYTSFKIFVQDDDKGKDYSASMSKYSKTINGHDVYSLTVYEDDGGWRHFQFWAINSNDGSIAETYKADDGSFWLYGSYVDGKIYNGYYDSAHHWDTPVWDRDDVYVTGTFNSWSTNTTKMTAVGKNDYTATVSLTSSDTFKFYVNGYDQKYWGHGSEGYRISESEWGSDLNNANGGKNIKAPSTDGDYILHFDPSAKKAYAVLVSQPTTSYYLTGYLNGASVNTTDNSRKFTETSSGSGVYTLTWAPESDHEGYQYATIYTGSTAYHPGSHPGANGAAATDTDSDPGDDAKWKVGAVAGQTVTFTWDTRGTNPTLSWTVSGGTVSSDWLYSKDGTTKFTPPTTSEGTFRFVWSTNDDGPGKSGTTAIATKVGTNAYWADITSYVKSNSQFYFALANNDNNGGIRGNKQEQINGEAIAPGSTGTISGGGFVAEMKEKSTVTGTAYFQLIRNVDFTKISAIGVLAEYSDSGKVNYKYYYKTVSSGDDQITTVNVYAKDGAAPINWDNKGAGGASATTGTAYNYAAIATTTITQIDGATPESGVVSSVACGDESSKYQVATVDAGKSITVKTTIASDYRSKYYVVGWCINGVTYKTDGTPGVNEASDTSTENGECTLTYTLPAEPTVDYLEITPIYYLRNTTGTITFYLEGYNTVVEKWGNTPYIYPFYGNLNNVSNSFGVYPGQPMVYAEGKYSTQIPLKDIPIIGASTNTPIKGITINNGYADHVHRNMIYKWTDHDNDQEHKQTYDYDDFYKIYEECLTNAAGESAGHPNSIIFRIIDETDTYNRNTYGSSVSGARVVGTKSSLTTEDLTNINSGNGWEVLRNRYNQPIDLFGNVLQTEPSDPSAVGDNVRIVSTGYNANIAGDYGTAWMVYKKNGSSYSLISDATNGRYAAPPSIFLLRGNASGYSTTITYPEANHSVTGVGTYTDSIKKYEGIYKAAYADSSVKGKPVYITYEKDAQDTRDNAAGTGAYRLDGRWYYTHSNDTVKSTVGIEYFDKAQNKWLPDTVSESTGDGASGSINKNNVKFNSNSYKDDTHVTTSKEAVINTNTTLNFTATAGTGYLFDGWYIKYSATSYDKIEGAAEAASIKATANYELIARFVPIVTGSLTIDHKLTGSSTGEGTVDMQVLVKDGTTTKATYNGSHIYIDGTYISNTYATYTIDVTLKTTPKYDGTVTAFGYDKFNTSKSIAATTSPESLPGNEGALTTSHFTFTVGDLYAGTTLSTSELTYYSTIAETPHYYNFTYNFTDRSGASKSYTAKGEILLKEYKQYVGDTGHELAASYIKAKAPFESNFLKKNTLNVGNATYSDLDHTFTATSDFAETVDLPVYTVRFKLPYDYYTVKSGDHKIYTAIESSYNADKATFDLAARYDQFVTTDASVTTPGTSTNVSKSTETNHKDNDFITAPDQVGNMNFAYWSIKRLADTADEQATAPEVARIYYPDFHYRIYGDYYVEAVFSDEDTNSWHNTYSDTNNSGCSILYVGDSRNQWNDGAGTTDDDATKAADMLYNDFIFNYRNNGAELKNSSNVKIGMIIERVADRSSSPAKWAMGSADVSDMSYYETVNYGENVSSVKNAILTALNGKDSAAAISRGGCIGFDWNTSKLNNKNNLEENYPVYSAYGQTVGDNSIEFKNDSAIDNYVYRAYAVMKYDSNKDGTLDTWCISDPAYFCMRYTANLKYSE
ncbi:glycogen-binding domain-containing protein [uncultured Ruminococcus sp.]|uniref:glycogen-binding domain-containing protein n=1 Tax=uncultured Ruminococcus sp. TaxID=165186 RepID=UPI00292E3FF4|nr:glycogen-binding domain-containing protein [uncultured Ruminococcus sp.]